MGYLSCVAFCFSKLGTVQGFFYNMAGAKRNRTTTCLSSSELDQHFFEVNINRAFYELKMKF